MKRMSKIKKNHNSVKSTFYSCLKLNDPCKLQSKIDSFTAYVLRNTILICVILECEEAPDRRTRECVQYIMYISYKVNI